MLQRFFRGDDTVELLEIARTLLSFEERATVGPLQRVLKGDPHLNRRRWAAWVLGLISDVEPRAAKALIQALLDPSQSQSVREEAAEALSHCTALRVIPALLSVLADANVSLRFWVVFALGRRRPSQFGYPANPQVVFGLGESAAGHRGAPRKPVGNRARGPRHARQSGSQYHAQVAAEIQRVLADPEAFPADRRWAKLLNTWLDRMRAIYLL